MKKNQKKIIIVAIILFIIMIIPFSIKRFKDGGSVEYRAILYKYTKIHRLNELSQTGYEDGWDLEILGFHIGGKINTNITNEHIISIRLNNKIIEANTGSFCYENNTYSSCIDKSDFQKFRYDIIPSNCNDKLYIDNLNGSIKSIELFDYSSKKFIDIEVNFTNNYIVVPNISGPYIFKINAIYEGKNIEYYFMTKISKIGRSDVEVIMQLKENTLSSGGLTMIIKNQSDINLEYGNPYTIEKYENGYWKSATMINDLSFTLPAFSLNKGESKELSMNWEYGYGKLKGKYRIVKEFSYMEYNDYISFNKYLEFEIQ